MKHSEILKKIRMEFEQGGRPVNLSELAAIALITVEDAGMLPPKGKNGTQATVKRTYAWESEDETK